MAASGPKDFQRLPTKLAGMGIYAHNTPPTRNLFRAHLNMIEQNKEGAGANPRVLVVDDDPDTLVFLGKLLSQIPADAVPTASCATARYAIKTLGSFDIVIADMVLPDGDGAALAAEFQRDHGCRTVIISGHDEPHDGLPEGVDLWVCKPVDLNRLKMAVVALAAK